MFDLVICDLDGTLIESIGDIHACLMHTLDHFGLPQFPVETTSSYVGDGTRLLLQRAAGDKYHEDMLTFFVKHYSDHPADHAFLYPGIMPFLMRLHEISHHAAILSNKTSPIVMKIAEHFRLRCFFEAVHGGECFQHKKPSPMPLIELMNRFNARPERTIMIGDSSHDIDAGHEAGTKTCFCLWGYGTVAQHTPTVSVHSPVALFDAISIL